MTQEDVFSTVVNTLKPYAKNQVALKNVCLTTHILEDLHVNSARLIDVVLLLEDAFEIEISDEDVDSVVTVGDTVRLIHANIG